MKQLKEELAEQNVFDAYEDALSMNAMIMSVVLVYLFKILRHLAQRIFEFLAEFQIGLDRAPPSS
ncbi:MAG: hypothetical protein AB8H47_27885 [Bacteroidia bacterium]